jgi:hypothetical protein
VIVALALAAALQSPAAVAIRATDYAISIPAAIPAGLVTFVFENKGAEPHYVRFVKIGAGHTMDDFVAWQKSGGTIPDWLESSGGAGAIAPGMAEEFTIKLDAGKYVALCSYPSKDGGQPHLEKGMYAPVEVGPARSTLTPPVESLVLTMHDHGFQLTAPIEAGPARWRIHNNGTEPHQALIVRLPEGVTEWQERTWFNGGHAPRGGIPIGGIVELESDADAWIRVDLKAGHYILLCSMLEQEGRHFELGMIYRFTVE